MQRYNRSFIGLMETSYSGEWMKVQDYEDKVGEMLSEYNKLIRSCNEKNDIMDCLINANLQLSEKKFANNILNFYTFGLIVIAIIVPVTLILIS
jgi:hypothetical protein